MSYKMTLPIFNHSNRNLLLVIEPWVEFYTLHPQNKIEITGQGGAPGSNFIVEYNRKYISIHAWPGSIATAYQDGVELEPEEQNIPDNEI